jgi:hypothetical protein
VSNSNINTLTVHNTSYYFDDDNDVDNDDYSLDAIRRERERVKTPGVAIFVALPLLTMLRSLFSTDEDEEAILSLARIATNER